MAQMISLEVTADHSVPVEPSLGGSVTVLNVSGDTLYYADNPQVSADNNQGTLTAGQSATFSPPQWLRSAGLSTVTVTVNDPAPSTGGGSSTSTVTLGSVATTTSVTPVTKSTLVATATLTADCVCTVPPTVAATVVFVLTQDATGGHLFSITDGTSTLELPGVATSATATSIVTVTSDGSNLYV